MEQIERQELYCHHCSNYVQFSIDLSLNGNHVLECPKCKHEHCRVVVNGKITDDRWDSRNDTNYINYNITVTATSTYDTYTSNYVGTSDYIGTANTGSGTSDAYSYTSDSTVLVYQNWLNHTI